MAVSLPEIPPVHGQHRNRALAAARRARAVELRTTGLTYDQIAVELGYANRGTVYHVISDALKAQTVEAADQLRSVEVERLDRLSTRCGNEQWRAMSPPSTRLPAASWLCRLLGLDGPSVFGIEAAKARTVVVQAVT